MMYVGTHYNNYYNYRFGDVASIYARSSRNQSSGIVSQLLSSNKSSLYHKNLLDSGAVKYVNDLKSGSADLKKAISNLTPSAAFGKVAVSSDTESMTVKSSGSKYDDPSFQGAFVTIDQVAAGQENKGATLEANTKVQAAGYQQFAIETNGQTYQFSINVSEGDTNQIVQQKMADAINQRNIGVNASVSMDKTNNTSTLSIQANHTGEDAKSRFQIRDVEGNAIGLTGIGSVTKEAQNAIYSVNGQKKTSKTNSIDLGDGVTAELKKASDVLIKVSLGTDQKKAIDMVGEMADSYNQLYSAALNNTDDMNANKLFSRLVNNSRTYSSSLSKVGIGFDSSGYMTIDQDKASKSAEDGSLERFLTENKNKNYGFTNQLSKIADDVGRNTSKYVSKSSFSSDFFDNSYLYDVFEKSRQRNDYVSGLLFDFMF